MVKFPCTTKLVADVDWVHLDTLESREQYIYLGNSGIHNNWHDRRFTVLNKTQSHSLVIQNVTVNDSAYYRCVEDSGLGHKHFYHLTVEGKLNFPVDLCVDKYNAVFDISSVPLLYHSMGQIIKLVVVCLCMYVCMTCVCGHVTYFLNFGTLP